MVIRSGHSGAGGMARVSASTKVSNSGALTWSSADHSARPCVTGRTSSFARSVRSNDNDSIAAPSGSPPKKISMEDISNILSLVNEHRWIAAAIPVLIVLARVLKSPALGSPLARIPVRLRPLFIGALGVAAGILQAVSTGKAWTLALLEGIGSAAWAIAIHGWGGGLSGPAAPASASPALAPELPIAPGAVPSVPEDTVAVPPPVTPDNTGLATGGVASAQPIVEPSEKWGPAPSGPGAG